MNATSQIYVTLRSKDRTQKITFRVKTEAEKAECERLARGALDVMLSKEVDGSGREFEVARADGAKIWERPLNKWD